MAMLIIRYSLHHAQPPHYNAITQLFAGRGWQPVPPNAAWQFTDTGGLGQLQILNEGRQAYSELLELLQGFQSDGVSVHELSLVFE